MQIENSELTSKSYVFPNFFAKLIYSLKKYSSKESSSIQISPISEANERELVREMGIFNENSACGHRSSMWFRD